MPRFGLNRWWTKVLALQLALFIATSAMTGSVMRAEAGQAYDSEPSAPPDPGLGGSGDPDVPTGNFKKPGMDRYPAVTEGSAAVVAPGSSSGSAWIYRLRFAVLSLRALLLRF
jgi:hypothetical protein